AAAVAGRVLAAAVPGARRRRVLAAGAAVLGDGGLDEIERRGRLVALELDLLRRVSVAGRLDHDLDLLLGRPGVVGDLDRRADDLLVVDVDLGVLRRTRRLDLDDELAEFGRGWRGVPGRRAR